jgi:hypothetical protein
MGMKAEEVIFVSDFKVGDILRRKFVLDDLPAPCYGPFRVKGVAADEEVVALARINLTGNPDADYGYYKANYFEAHDGGPVGRGFDEMGLANWGDSSLIVYKPHSLFKTLFENWWISYSKQEGIRNIFEMKVWSGKPIPYLEFSHAYGSTLGASRFRALWDKLLQLSD